MEEYKPCFSCGAKALNFEGNCHEYMLSSPGCYEMFTEVLEKEYSDFRYSKAHHYTVDAYATQHPGDVTNQKAINSVGIHLVSLYFLFEKSMNLDSAAELKMAFAQFNKTHKMVQPLQKLEKFNGLTIFDIWDNEKPEHHFELSKIWAKSSWDAWAKERITIEKWALHFLEETGFNIKY
ncbi:DUF5946 family protein [Flagellimonas eckloniae]|nr:DUF5946 family protein [Allomuricauda eckloniae]